MNSYPLLTSPEEIPLRFAEGWNERDAGKIAAIFDEDADFVNVAGIWWRNREDIRKAHDYGLRVIFKDSDLKVTKTEVKYLSESVAIVHARMRLKGQTPEKDGEKPEMRFNIFTFVAHKTESRWSCAAAQNTDMLPGKETNKVVGGVLQPAYYRKK
ncbi:MAG: SgcJ/EcaC family oxidoreductase [Balneolaceae bacterium]|nr:MAG: SgcJ/EcaC family oxidoreductase [Balneolaceae bacterium]